MTVHSIFSLFALGEYIISHGEYIFIVGEYMFADVKLTKTHSFSKFFSRIIKKKMAAEADQV